MRLLGAIEDLLPRLQCLLFDIEATSNARQIHWPVSGDRNGPYVLQLFRNLVTPLALLILGCLSDEQRFSGRVHRPVSGDRHGLTLSYYPCFVSYSNYETQVIAGFQLLASFYPGALFSVCQLIFNFVVFWTESVRSRKPQAENEFFLWRLAVQAKPYRRNCCL